MKITPARANTNANLRGFSLANENAAQTCMENTAGTTRNIKYTNIAIIPTSEHGKRYLGRTALNTS